MAYDRGRLPIVFRITLIILCGYSAGYFFWFTPYSLLALWLLLGAAFTTLSLVRYADRTRTEFATFLLNIKQRDFTPSYARYGRNADLLHQGFESLNNLLAELHAEKEQQARYLQTVVAHVQVALISYNSEGEITLCNEAAKELFQRPVLRALSELQVVDPALYESLKFLRAGDQKLVKFVRNGDLQYLAVRATEFKLQGKHYTLLSFSDIRSELEEQEVESWQKLIRVLTHEIMNSAIPITTLTEVSHGMLLQPDGSPRSLLELDDEEEGDLRGSLETISRRSKGLVNFVNAYKDLNQVPEPNITTLKVDQLLGQVARLMEPNFQGSSIELQVAEVEDWTLLGDAALLEQVLINLISNAKEAIQSNQEKGKVMLGSEKQADRIIIFVEDDGPGIPTGNLDKVFIPFFTTKASGSGIGLALTRQIMRLHKGSVTVQSAVGSGTRFQLVF